jgi:molybdopterin-synthase adenylyltransferase
MPGPRIAVVGAGGLGAPLCFALARAGAAVQVFDADTIDISNLHRQLAFALDDVGRAKASALAAALRGVGGEVSAVDARWTAARDDGAADLAVIVDGSDDPETKFAVADWATARGLPSVIAGALGVGGNVFSAASGSACFRCLFEAPPAYAPSCADAGVLGPVVAQVAAVAAAAALRLAAGDRSLAGTLWVLEDALGARPPRTLALTPRPGCPSCGAARLRAAPPIA